MAPKFLSMDAVICGTLLSISSLMVQGWAPAQHLDPTKLPKALEFAEKAWKFPNSMDPQGPKVVGVQHDHEDLQRRYPWSSVTPAQNSKDLSLACMEDGDNFYFDGQFATSLNWPTRSAFLASLPKPTAELHLSVNEEKKEKEDCDNYYYDDSGGLLCWATIETAKASMALEQQQQQNAVGTTMADHGEEECEHTYFDRIGGDSLCWAFLGVAETLAASVSTKHLTTHPGHQKFDEDDCEEHYYDDMGDIMCWVV